MSQPRYSFIAETLSHRIAQGIYPKGKLVPTEKELMDEFGVSRHTVRAAMGRLESAGLIERRRGHGTVVLNADAAGAFSQPLATLEDLVHLAAVSPRSLHSQREVVVDVDLASVLGVDPGTRWLRFSSTRAAANGEPIVWTDVYVAKTYEGVRKFVRVHPDRLISDLIEENFGCRIESVEQEISTVALPVAVAAALQVEKGSAGMRILRRYRDSERNIVIASESFHPAGRYTFSTVLVRQRGVHP
ncbi:GntR family transcriptional regulator [Parapusillimonas sp. SGNA-6]|nr:GntR family transcriptional regulator [Parapusillimonas sp. SGNA-6]